MRNQKSETQQDVEEYYGKTLASNQDLKTSACCSVDAFAPHVREVIKEIHPEVIEKFYGCGSPIPDCLGGINVLDLGSGSGRDCFILHFELVFAY